MASLDTPRLKIMTVGSAGVGKSCFIKRYCEGRFVAKYVSTIGIDYGVKKYDLPAASSGNPVLAAVLAKHPGCALGSSSSGAGGGNKDSCVRVNFWDVAGGPESYEIRNEFYTSAQGVFLIFDVTDRDTFTALETEWWPELLRYLPDLQQQQQQQQAAAGRRVSAPNTTSATPAGRAVGETSKAPVLVLVGNKCDGGEGTNGRKRAVTREEAEKWAAGKGIAHYFDTSASSGAGVTEAMETLFLEAMIRFYY